MNALIRKLELFGPLDPEDRLAIEALCDGASHHRADEEVGRGVQPGTVPVMLSGFAYRFKLLSDGRRQIQGLLLPGDLCRHIYAFLTSQADHAIRTLTPSVVASVPSSALMALMGRHPRVERALRANAVIEEAVLREWVVSLGRRTAYERMAHLFCEIFLRLRAVGLADGNRCELPLTQMDLGDLMGLSTVHVNRVLQQLRRDELIILKGSQLTILDLGLLGRAADLDANYLQLDAAGRDDRDGVAVRIDAA